jgi:hypothetical protein
VVEYNNNDKLTYKSLEDFFEATHDEKMLRIQMDWEYTVKEVVSGIEVSIPYDIIIFYEIEQDSDQREMFKLEEWGAIHVEGCDNDWINVTLSELKILTKSTKMPFWWYYPKKAFLAMREYTNYLLWVFIFMVISIFLVPLFSGSNSDRIQFIEQVRQIFDASEKLQKYIEYSLTPTNSNKLLLTYLLIYGLGGLLTILFTKFSRYLFPRSMILIGSMQSKQRNLLIAYSFIWGAVITTLIGIIISIIL